VGDNIIQKVSNTYNQKVENFLEELRTIGVPNEDLNEVEQILKKTNKNELPKKLMNWVGKMSTRVVESSIDLKLPLLFEKVSQFL
jgi:hypothetical protein